MASRPWSNRLRWDSGISKEKRGSVWLRTVALWPMECDRLVAKVDVDLGFSRLLSPGRGDRLPIILVQLDDQQAVIEGVRFEDVGEAFSLAGGDDRPVAGLHDGPDGMLATRSASEIAPDHQHGRVANGRVIERELGIGRTMAIGIIDLGSSPGGVPLVGEEQRTEARPLDALQVARRDDQIGVDVGPVQDGQPAAV